VPVEDRIGRAPGGDLGLGAAARRHETYLVKETLALEVDLTGAAETADAQVATIEGRDLRIGVRRAG
jgi:hypothetical protein